MRLGGLEFAYAAKELVFEVELAHGGSMLLNRFENLH